LVISGICESIFLMTSLRLILIWFNKYLELFGFLLSRHFVMNSVINKKYVIWYCRRGELHAGNLFNYGRRCFLWLLVVLYKFIRLSFQW
jgi:hypothetical protein